MVPPGGLASGVMIRSRYDGSVVPVRVVCGEELLTKQEFKDDCDLNRLMKKYVRGGELPVSSRKALYADCSQVADFLEAQLLVQRAGDQFAALPANVRERFKNSPAAFLEFMADKANQEEAGKLGLVEFKKGETVKVETLKTTPAEPAAKETK